MQLPRPSTANGSATGPGAPQVPLALQPRPGARFVGLVLLCSAVAAFISYLVVNVPLTAPRLSQAEAHRYWGAAALAALVVLAGVAAVLSEVLRARRRSPEPVAGATVAAASRPLIPRSLGFEHVPGRAVAIAAGISLLAVCAALAAGVQLWVGGLCLVLPWIPVVAAEVRWKQAQYGVFAMFALLVLLQVLHMGEHTMQVGQLLVHRGDLAQSHGVFGQLDFELVHFVTDTTLWITLGLLVVIFKGRNPWLWVAFAAASLHQIEHFYLFWLYHAHQSVYADGGFAGIMGEGGMIGSPLDRPYLHFTYNFIVLVPMGIALWDEARHVDREPRDGRSPTGASSPRRGRGQPAR